MTEENHLITDRKKKIELWEQLGFPAYAKDFERTHTAAQAAAEIHDNAGNLRAAPKSSPNHKPLAPSVVGLWPAAKWAN
jgi:hypothetical protein